MSLSVTQDIPNVRQLCHEFSTHLKDSEFIKLEDRTERLTRLLKTYNEQFADPYLDASKHYGFEELKIVPQGTTVAVKGDMHASLGTLIEYLSKLQKDGLLDEDLNCRKGVILVFLGDVVNQGRENLEVVEVLITLRMKNPDQVVFIQGNHDDVDFCKFWAEDRGRFDMSGQDPRFERFLKLPSRSALLQSFFRTMSLTTIIGTSYFMQFAHAQVGELWVDRAKLLSGVAGARLYVPNWENRPEQLSKRIQQLSMAKESSELAKAARRVQELFKKETERKDVTQSAYYWGRVTVGEGKESTLGPLTRNQWSLTPEDVKSIQRITSPGVRVTVRGHDHNGKIYHVKDEVVMVSCDVAKSSIQGERSEHRTGSREETAYIITYGAIYKECTVRNLYDPSRSVVVIEKWGQLV